MLLRSTKEVSCGIAVIVGILPVDRSGQNEHKIGLIRL